MKIQNEEQAAEALAALSEFYGEPVMPVRRYCAAIETWATCVRKKRHEELKGEHPIPSFGQHFADYLDKVLIHIRKSNLLCRLIYKGQALRLRPCPEHKGKWVGVRLEPCPHGCSDGYNVTGWLPEQPASE